jgi:hypothetical protein
MANIKQQQAPLPYLDTGRPPEERAKLWLDTTGLPLEFKAAEILFSSGFSIGQGVFVPGEHARDGLELDVLATLRGDFAEFHVLTECKYVASPAALVAMFGARSAVPNPPWPIWGMGISDDAQFLDSKDAQHFAKSLGPTWTEAPAMSLRTLGEQRKKQADVDDRFEQKAFYVLQGLAGRTLSLLEGINARARQTHRGTPSLIVPVLVVDGDLVAATWSPDTNSFDTKPIEQAWVAWGGNSQWPLPFFSVAVATVQALPTLTAELKEWGNSWCRDADKATATQIAALARKKSQRAEQPKPPWIQPSRYKLRNR